MKIYSILDLISGMPKSNYQAPHFDTTRGPLGQACERIRRVRESRLPMRLRVPIAWPTAEEVMATPGFGEGEDE